jgi:hypothetical protein
VPDVCERCGAESPLVDEHVCALHDPCRIEFGVRQRCLHGTHGCLQEHMPPAEHGLIGRVLRRLFVRP